MNRIPVGATISGAFGFAFGEFLSIVGIVWFPWLVMFGLCAGAVYLIAPDFLNQLKSDDFDVMFLAKIGRIYGLIWLVGIVIGSMVKVGLQKKALGLMPGPTFFYFSLGAPVWMMIGAYILAFVALLFLLLVTAAVAGAAGFAAVKFVAHYGIALAVVIGIVAVCWYIYACVRLLFFLPAVVVSEGELGLGRSWELGGGNFWRIIAVLFVVYVPVAIAFNIIQNVAIGPLVPPDFATHFHIDPKMAPEDVAKLYAKIFGAVLHGMWLVWPIFLVLTIIQSLIYSGLGNGAVAKAYLAVTGKSGSA